jgi:hypothetical protein
VLDENATPKLYSLLLVLWYSVAAEIIERYKYKIIGRTFALFYVGFISFILF